MLNKLIRPKDSVLKVKINDQSKLFLQDLDFNQFDKVIHFGSGFVSYKDIFNDKIYYDYDRYIYGQSNLNLILSNQKDLRTLLLSISVFQHLKLFHATMEELLANNVTEIRTVIDCSLRDFPKVRNREIVGWLRKTRFFNYITQDIYISDRKISDYIFFFQVNGYELVELKYIDKEYRLTNDDSFEIYYVIWRRRA